MAWLKDHTSEIAVLRACLSELETALAKERAARLADKLDVLGKLSAMGQELGRAVSGLRPQRTEGAKQFGNATDFRKAIEREEGTA